MLDLFLQRSGGRGSLEQLGLGSGCQSFGLKVWGEGLRLLGRKFRVRVSIVGCIFLFGLPKASGSLLLV